MNETTGACSRCTPPKKNDRHWRTYIILALAIFAVVYAAMNASQISAPVTSGKNQASSSHVLDDPETYYRMCGPPTKDFRVRSDDGTLTNRAVIYPKKGIALRFSIPNKKGTGMPNRWTLTGVFEYPSMDRLPPDALTTRMSCLVNPF